VAAEIDVGRAGCYWVGVEAQGTQVSGVYPVLEVEAGRGVVGRIYVGSEKIEPRYTRVQLSAGQQTVRFFFTNDLYEPPEDRNVTIHSVMWAPAAGRETFEALTEPAVLARVPVSNGFVYIDQVRWDTTARNALQANDYVKHLLLAVGVEPELKLSVSVPPSTFEVLSGAIVHISESDIAMATNCKLRAAFEIEVPGRYSVTVPARGEKALGEWPIISVSLDGATPRTFRVETAGFSPYTTRAGFKAGEHTIDVAFTNDAWKPPEDRNLWMGPVSLRLEER